jgi:Family of unknown function (DUF6011)
MCDGVDHFAHLGNELPGDEPEDDTGPVAETSKGKLTTAEAALRFMRGGNATVTLLSMATGTRFTYRLRASEDRRVTFVAVLTGSDNESSYAYLGYIKTGQEVYWHGGRKAKVAADAPSAKAFNWAWRQLIKNQLPADKLEIFHEGRCGRCGRKLTVPASILSGFGPECVTRMGG